MVATTPCMHCGREFGPAFIKDRSCVDCRLARQLRAKAGRCEEFRQMVPPAFLDTRMERLPNESAAMKALKWEYGPKGLLLAGDTRRGKTRTAWLVLKRNFEEFGHTFAYHNGPGFDVACIDSFKNDGGHAAFVRGLERAKILVLDDIDKCKFTDRVQEVLFGIFETRLIYERPVIVTTNIDRSTLAKRMPLVGVPLTERLGECCETIVF